MKALIERWARGCTPTGLGRRNTTGRRAFLHDPVASVSGFANSGKRNATPARERAVCVGRPEHLSRTPCYPGSVIRSLYDQLRQVMLGWWKPMTGGAHRPVGRRGIRPTELRVPQSHPLFGCAIQKRRGSNRDTAPREAPEIGPRRLLIAQERTLDHYMTAWSRPVSRLLLRVGCCRLLGADLQTCCSTLAAASASQSDSRCPYWRSVVCIEAWPSCRWT